LLYKRLGGYGAIAAATDEFNAGLPVTSNCVLAVVAASRWRFEQDEFW